MFRVNAFWSFCRQLTVELRRPNQVCAHYFPLTSQCAGVRSPVSLETKEAGWVLFGHHVDVGLTEARFGEDRQRRLKGLGVVHPAGLSEVGADYDVGRTEGANIRNLLRSVVHHRLLGADGLRT